jgi:hypothetical protein
VVLNACIGFLQEYAAERTAAAAGALRAGDQLLPLSRSTGQAEVEALFQGPSRSRA